jgi:membrane protein YqaA with SNARE-associated domain
MLHQLYHWTLHWAATPQAEWALFFLAIAESSFFPIPPDLLLITMAVAEPMNSFWFALISSIGSVLGGCIGYGIGRYGGQPLLKRFVKEEKIQHVETLFNRYDAWAIIIAAFTPIPYKVFTIASGAFNINFKTFILSSLIGRAGRFFLVATLFYFFGASIKGWINQYLNLVTIGLMVLLIGGFLSFRLLKRKLTHHNPDHV